MNETLELSDGGHLAYQVQGNGPPLLLVAGLGGMGNFWDDFARNCSDTFTVITYDHRGTGASSRCDRPYSIASMAEDVRALCDHLHIQNPFYIGHSTGGAIGQYLACHTTLNMRALVLSATFGRPCAYFRRLFEARLQILGHLGMKAYTRHSELFLYPPYWLAENPMDDTAHTPSPQDTTAAPQDNSTHPDSVHPLDAVITQRRIHAILAHDALDDLGQITCPTLVISARDDTVTPDYHSVQLAQGIPDAELILMARGGHFLPQTDAPRYLEHVLQFLRSHA